MCIASGRGSDALCILYGGRKMSVCVSILLFVSILLIEYRLHFAEINEVCFNHERISFLFN